MTSPLEPRSGTTPPEGRSGPDAEARPDDVGADEIAPAGDAPRADDDAGRGAGPDASPADVVGEAPAAAGLADGAQAGEGPAGEAPRRRRRKRRRAAAEAGGGEAAGGGPGEAAGAEAKGGAGAGAAGGAGERPAGVLDALREPYMRVDRRLLGVFRIYFGVTLIVDVLRRVPEATFFYSSSGAFTNHHSLYAPMIRPYVSIYAAFSTTAEVRFAFVATAAAYFLYLVGYRTRLMQVVAFFLYANLNARNTFVENGGTVVFTLLALWTMFLPLGDRFSVDAVLRGLRARREHAPEALNDRAGFRPPANAHFSLAMLAVTVQVAAIYFFNAAHKSGETWRRGESIHWVLWQNRIATGLAGWLRLHEPAWLSPAMTTATLTIEGAAPVLVLAPVAQKYLRTAHVVLTWALHVGIALLMTLGPFSYVMCGLNLLLLPAEALDWAAARWAARKPRLLVAYDPADAAAHQLARLLSRLDALGRLRFASADAGPGGRVFFARAEAGGAWSADGDALAACLRALPFGSLARLLPARALGARYFERRREIVCQLGLRAGRPASAPGPAAEPAPGPSPARRRLGALGARAREALVGVFLLAALIQLSHDNAWVPKRLRFRQPSALAPLVRYPRLVQGWRMFSPDAPKDDGTVVVDALTADGRHLDPFTGRPPDFDAPLHGPWFQSQPWCDYFRRISWDGHDGNREELKKYILNWQRLEGRPANDRVVSFEVWWVSNDSPPPGHTAPFNIKKRLLVAGRSLPRGRRAALRSRGSPLDFRGRFLPVGPA